MNPESCCPDKVWELARCSGRKNAFFHFASKWPQPIPASSSFGFLNSEDPIVLIGDHAEIGPYGRRTEEDKVLLKELLNPRFVFDSSAHRDSACGVGDSHLSL